VLAVVFLYSNKMDDYWKKENPKYIDLKLKIESIENRINSGVITNSKTLSLRNRDLKRLKKELSETTKYLIGTEKEKFNCLCCNTESKVLSDNGLVYECLNCGDWEYSSS
jgi:hypothetical protein